MVLSGEIGHDIHVAVTVQNPDEVGDAEGPTTSTADAGRRRPTQADDFDDRGRLRRVAARRPAWRGNNGGRARASTTRRDYSSVRIRRETPATPG